MRATGRIVLPAGGAVRQAFECAVQARLADQYRTLALLQAQLQNPLPRAGALTATWLPIWCLQAITGPMCK